MRIRFFLFIILHTFLTSTFAQLESVPTNHPVYNFLYKLRLQKKLPRYNDIILPLSRSEVLSNLSKVELSQIEYGHSDSSRLSMMKDYFTISSSNEDKSFIDGEVSFLQSFSAKKENYFYLYSDSIVRFCIMPIFSSRFINSNLHNSGSPNSNLFTYGGAIAFNYDNWLSAYVEAWNGFSLGNRDVAKLDSRVSQSYTFDSTGLDYFDGTAGYTRLYKGIFTLEIGRERILEGVSFLNRSVLNSNAQMMDFLRLNINYKAVNFSFLHGWLVQPKKWILLDSINGDIKRKDSKYFSSVRLGVTTSDNFNFGVSQSVIYAYRPFELAYMNPFLFWESVQRSMNDLDNSFLTFDMRYLISHGIELYSSITFDDLNFDLWKKGLWHTRNNRLTFQLGVGYTPSKLVGGLTTWLEYYHIRPFTYSHAELGEGLTYTNNGNPLAINLPPNSDMINLRAEYDANSSLMLGFDFRHYRHGANILDAAGNLIKNTGGDFFVSTAYKSEFVSPFLDGELQEWNSYEFLLKYYYSYSVNFEIDLQYIDRDFSYSGKQHTIFSFRLNYNLF